MVKISIFENGKNFRTLEFVVKDDTNARKITTLVKKELPNEFLISQFKITDKNGIPIKPNQQIRDDNELYLYKEPLKLSKKTSFIDFYSLLNIETDEITGNKNTITLQISPNSNFLHQNLSQISIQDFLIIQYGCIIPKSEEQGGNIANENNSLNYVIKIQLFSKSFNIIVQGNQHNKQSLEPLILAECHDIIKKIKDPKITLYGASRSSPPFLIEAKPIDISYLEYIKCEFISHGIVYDPISKELHKKTKDSKMHDSKPNLTNKNCRHDFDNPSDRSKRAFPDQALVKRVAEDMSFEELRVAATYIACSKNRRSQENIINRVIDWAEKSLEYVVGQGLANATNIPTTSPKLKRAVKEAIRSKSIERGIIMIIDLPDDYANEEDSNGAEEEEAKIKEVKTPFIPRQHSSSYPCYDQLKRLCNDSKEEADAFVAYFQDDMALIQKLAEIDLVK